MANGGERYAERSEKSDYIFKVVMIGDSGVGKSQILSRFARDTFSLESRSTIGVDLQTRTVVIKEKTIQAQIWDTAGQERYRVMTTAYYRGALGAMLVYDITNRQSFNNITRWLAQLRDTADKNVFVILIGNKSELQNQRAVPKVEAIRLAEKEGLFFMETSALTAENVKTAFSTLLNEIFYSLNKKELVVDETRGKGNLDSPLEGKKIIIPGPAQEIPAKSNMCSKGAI